MRIRETIRLLVFVGMSLPSTAFSQTSAITGLWRNEQFGYAMDLELNKDGSGIFEGEALRYTVQGSVLRITSGGEITDYQFKVEGARLTLSGGDLDGLVVFQRPATQKKDGQSTQSYSPTSKEILGLWSGDGEMIEFKPNGNCMYGGNEYVYKVSQGHIIIDTPAGSVIFQYALDRGTLVLTANGQTSKYTRPDGYEADQSARASTRGQNPRELVGQWCYMKMSTQSQTSRCITLYQDGTYVYAGENSMSVNTPELSGGTSSQNSDKGVWYVEGDRIYYDSPTMGKGSYRLEKRNHPKNVNDPMIVLDGEPYVTATRRSPWR